MSNLDPFTEKLLQRTQARKEARLKLQNLNTLTSTIQNEEQEDTCNKQKRSPLTEKLLEDNKETSDALISSPTKRPQSTSVDLNCSAEKKSKLTNITEKPDSPVQKVTVTKATVEGSPKYVNKPSLASRLNRLKEQYSEQLFLDSEEEKRIKEAEALNAERKREQQEERAQAIQERIFGKDYIKQKEDEKLNQLKEKYLGTSSSVHLQKHTKVSNIVKPTGERTGSFRQAIKSSQEPSQETDEEVQPSVHNNVSVIKEVSEVEMERKGGCLMAAGQGTLRTEKYQFLKPDIKPKPSIDLESMKPMVGIDKLKNLWENPDNEQSCTSVQNKKSIFEEKMKQEAAARAKEKEAEDWLQMKGCRRSALIDTEVVPEIVPTIAAETGKSSAKDAHDQDSDPNDSNENSSLSKVVPKTPEKLISQDCVTPSKNYTGVNSPQPIDCTEDTQELFSDTQAFDASLSLQPEVNQHNVVSRVKHERCYSNRYSTMKVESAHLAMVKPLPELNMTPIQNETIEEEVLSEFAKAIKNKVKDMKSVSQKQKLEFIDLKTRPKLESESDEKVEETNSASCTSQVDTVIEKPILRDHIDVNKNTEITSKPKSGKQPVKPPRTSKKNLNCEEPLPTNAKSNKKKAIDSVKDRHHSSESKDTDVISKPKDQYARKKMRKSSSFSEGQNNTPIKSGYHRELSEKYNACASFDKPDIVMSKKIQIQNLLEEAATQQNIVLQASQALNVAEYSIEDRSNSPEVIEGERLLLLATERRTICLDEVKILKEAEFKGHSEPPTHSDYIPPCMATLALTDIRLPLHKEFVNSLKSRKSDIGAFHFIVTVSIGYKNIQSTKVVSCTEDIDDCALSIKSNILLKNVPYDFKLTIKVFGMHSNRCNDQISKVRKKEMSGQSSPGNLKSLFSKKHKDDDPAQNASPQTVFRTSNFKLVGETKVNLSMIGNSLTKYVLTKVPSNCPVEGCIQLRASCRPEYISNVSGFLTILEDVGGYTAWNRRWCNMKDDKVLYWRYPDDEKDKDSMGNVDLRYCHDKVIKLLPRDICARPHTFELNLKRATQSSDNENLITTIEGKSTRVKYWISCDNKEDRVTWMDAFNKQLSDSRAWRVKKISTKTVTSPRKV